MHLFLKLCTSQKSQLFSLLICGIDDGAETVDPEASDYGLLPSFAVQASLPQGPLVAQLQAGDLQHEPLQTPAAR